MANKVRRDGVWERAAADLEKKGYTVESSANGNGTPVFVVTDPGTGKVRTTTHPNQIAEWAGTWSKAAQVEAGTELSVDEGSNHPLRRKSDLYGITRENNGNIADSVAAIEKKGGILAQPSWQGGNYEVMDSAGEIFTTRRAGDINAIGNLASEKPEGLKGKIAETFGKTATRRERDSEWVNGFLNPEPEPAI